MISDRLAFGSICDVFHFFHLLRHERTTDWESTSMNDDGAFTGAFAALKREAGGEWRYQKETALSNTD